MADLTNIKAKLEQKLRHLTRRVVTIDGDLREPGDDDWSEQATESENDEALEEIGDSTLREIEQIKQALKQIEAGRYGVCAKCKRPISEKRLEALPDATLCVKCA